MKLAAVLAALIAAAPLAAKGRSGLDSIELAGQPSGARFIGMGESATTLNGLPESPMYNPAALGDLTASFLAFDMDVANQSSLPKDVVLNASPLSGKKFTYLGVASTGKAVFYRPITSFDHTTVTVATDPANNFVQDEVHVNQFGIAAAQASEKDSTVGLTISYLNARRGFAQAVSGQPPVLELADGNGFSLDIGVQNRRGPFVLGLAAFNLPGLIWWDKYKTDQLPIQVRSGLAFAPSAFMAFTTEYEKRFYLGDLPMPDIWHFGLELAPLSWLALRAGARSEDFNDQNKTAYTWGLSMKSKQTHTLDLSARIEHLDNVKVVRYFLSFIFPLGTPETPRQRRRQFNAEERAR